MDLFNPQKPFNYTNMSKSIDINKLENPYVQVIWEDTPDNFTQEKIKSVKQYFQKKYRTTNVNVITKLKNVDDETMQTVDVSINIMEKNYQVELIKNFLKSKNYEPYIEKVLDLDRIVENQIVATSDDVAAFKKWYIKKIEFSNFLSYGENQVINFDKCNGITVVESDPPNFGGKTVLTVDLLMFLFFNTTTKTSKAEEIFKNPDVYALGGPAVTPVDAGYKERMSGWLFSSVVVSGTMVYRYIPGLKILVDDYPSVNLFVRKKAFEEVSGFMTEFWPGEDTKLCLDLVRKNERKFPYDPDVVVYHHRREIYMPYLKQISRYGRYRGQFARIFPQTSRIPIYFMPSLFVLGLTFGSLLVYLLPFLLPIYVTCLVIYVIGVSLTACRISKLEKEHIRTFIIFSKGVFLTHVVYGINFLIGIVKKPRLKLKNYDKKTGNYLEG